METPKEGDSMERLLWVIIMLPFSALFTGIGIYAWKRRKPMWFWSGSTVSGKEISDIPAYNRANGIMWVCYSAVFWVSTVVGVFRITAAGVLLAVGSLGGIPVLIIVYGKIYRKYRGSNDRGEKR